MKSRPSFRLNESPFADRFRGAFLGLAVGDALGVCLEANPADDAQALASWVKSVPSALPNSVHVAMTMATAHSLIEARGFHADHMAETLAAQIRMECDVRPAREVLEEALVDEAQTADLDSATSFGNGAALRATPIGLFYHQSPERAAEAAAEGAWFTHAHPLGADGAALQAAAIAEVMQAQPHETELLLGRLVLRLRTRRFREHLEKWDALSGSVATTKSVSGNGVEADRSVPTALFCFLQNPGSFHDALFFALSLGGNSSALASMTCALAGARLGVSAIPEEWLALLDNRDELTDLADRLLAVAETPD